MKIKYIGNFTDGTGWAKASTYNALCLDSAGHDVYCKEIKYNSANIELEPRISELLNKESDNFDYTIHHVLPTQYTAYPNTVNIGFLPVESTISNMIWLKNLNMMDQIFVPDSMSKKYLQISGLNKPIKVFNHSFNYSKISEYIPTQNIPELTNSFNFVFVGEFSARKDLENLVRAFHSEFEYAEPVNLFIKTSGNPENVKMFLQEVKKRLKKSNKLKNEILVTGYISENDLLSIYKQCHCFVTASHGEAWCYPAAEAMAAGLRVVYPKETGIDYYASSGVNYPIHSVQDYCYGATDSVDGLYTCEDIWTTISNADLRKEMRKVFTHFIEDQKEFLQKSQRNSRVMKEFDYRNSDLVKELF